MARSRTFLRFAVVFCCCLTVSVLLSGCVCTAKKTSASSDAKACAACADQPCAKCSQAAESACCPQAGACPMAAGGAGFSVLPEGQELPAPERLSEYGYTDLFDGKTTEGWAMCGPGSFELRHGELLTRGGMGMLWYKEKPFKDFTLVVEWMNTRREDNSGIFVRFPDPGDDPWAAVNGGYEVQIDDAAAPPACSGSIYSFAPAAKLSTRGTNLWNRYEITVVGQHYTIVVNGEKVCEFEGERGTEGYIGLQNHDPTTLVRFRRVAVKEL